jgi:TBC1 domain family member 2
LKCVIRLWDTYISEDGFEDFHVYVCAAFLCQFSSQLQSMDFDELFGFMQVSIVNPSESISPPTLKR